jgi:hypothetical protein
MAGSFIATLKRKLPYRERRPIREPTKRATFEYLEVSYSRGRAAPFVGLQKLRRLRGG